MQAWRMDAGETGIEMERLDPFLVQQIIGRMWPLAAQKNSLPARAMLEKRSTPAASGRF
jgi:hypothetical protein